MKKIVIVGGGITGCVSAIYCAQLGLKVEIYEKKNNLGGVISDIQIENDFFFNGPQYYNEKSPWLIKLRKNKVFKDLFYNFNLRYGSYNDLFNKNISSKNFAQIQTDVRFRLLKKKKTTFYKDRINCYQKDISDPIKEWSEKYCKNYKILHSSCSSLMNTGRVFFSNDRIKIKNLKKINSYADELLGIPDKKFQDQKFCLPTLGNNFFFKRLENFLKLKKIKINFNSTIKLNNENSKLKFYQNKKQIQSNYFIWCANPVPLIKASGFGLLDNPTVNVLILSMNIDLEKSLSNNLYLQIFSKKNNLFRIFIYKIGDLTKLSLEVIFDKNLDIEKEINFAIRILKKHDIFVKKYWSLSKKKEIRHMLFSVNDLKKFEKFEKSQISNKILSGAWQLIGREKKINYIINNIDKYINN